MKCNKHSKVDISETSEFFQSFVGDACFGCLVSLANSIETFRATNRKPEIRLEDLQKRVKKALGKEL